MDLGAVVGIGKMLGGLLGDKGPSPAEQYRMAEEHQYHLLTQQPGAMRKGMEKAGFNPTLAFGGGLVPSQPTIIGDSYSQAGALFGDGLNMVHDALLSETQLAKENEKLRETLDKVAKPKVPGHMEEYGGVIPLPSNGGSNAVREEFHSNNRRSDDSSPVDIRLGGNAVAVDTGTTDAEIYEQRYGEIGGSILGAVPMLMDFEQTIYEYLQPKGSELLSAEQRRMKKSRPRARPGEDPGPAIGYEWGSSAPRSVSPSQQEIDTYNFRRRVLFGD